MAGGTARRTNEVPSTTLYNLTRITSGDIDVQTLMTHLFNLLKTEVDYDIGAFVASHENYTEGRIYKKAAVHDDALAAFSGYLSRRSAPRCDASSGVPEKFEVSVLSCAYGRAFAFKSLAEPAHYYEFALEYAGRPAGVIALASYNPGRKNIFADTAVIDAMARHANNVMERLFSQMFAEGKRLSNILHSMGEGVYIIGKNGRLTTVNPKGLEIIHSFCPSCAEAVSKGLLDCGPLFECDCEFAGFLKKVKDTGPRLGMSVHREEIKNQDGRHMELSLSSLTTEENREYGYVVTAKDVTENRLMQKRVLISNRLASLGEMAAGIAHEINNPLQAMLANLELLESAVQPTGKARLDRVRSGVVRISGIVKDLLIFAREKTTETENADINQLIEKSVDLFKHQMRIANVDVRMELHQRPLIIPCNRNMFQQVIINLLQNAKDAIEESSRGSAVGIRTGLSDDGRIEVVVSDDGPGIPDNIVDRIFDPFFTTKDVGKGTGLGLSVSRKIIEGLGGAISVKSGRASGTTFRISLPHSGAVMEERRAGRRREVDPTQLAGKSVLLVDDEEVILDAVKDGLPGDLMRVEAMRDSVEAFERLKASDFDFVILDVRMPGMSGMDLFRRITDLKPHLTDRIIFLTGDTLSARTSEFLKSTKCRYLTKPVSTNEIMAAMSDIARKAYYASGAGR